MFEMMGRHFKGAPYVKFICGGDLSKGIHICIPIRPALLRSSLLNDLMPEHRGWLAPIPNSSLWSVDLDALRKCFQLGEQSYLTGRRELLPTQESKHFCFTITPSE